MGKTCKISFALTFFLFFGWECVKAPAFPFKADKICIEDEKIEGFPHLIRADESEGLVILYREEAGAAKALRFDLDGRLVEQLTCLPPTDDTWEFVEDFERIQKAHPHRNWNCRLVDNEGHIYVANMQKGQIEKFDLQARLIGRFGGGRGDGPGQLKAPIALGLDGQGNLYVLDEKNRRVTRFDQTGAFLDRVEIPVEDIGPENQMKVDTKGTLFLLTPRGKSKLKTRVLMIKFPLKQSGR